MATAWLLGGCKFVITHFDIDKEIKKTIPRDIPGGPVVKTVPPMQGGGGTGSISGWETKILHVLW